MDGTWSWPDLGRRVREARIAAGLSQEALGQRLGLGRTIVVKVEAGKREVDALELARLAEVLKLPMSHFLTRPPEVLSRRVELSDDTTSDVAGQSYRLEAALQAWLADIEQLVALGSLALPAHQSYDRPVQDHRSAVEAAQWVRGVLDLGTDPVASLMGVCQRMGQLVAVVETPGDGASLIEGGVAAAVVSVTGDPGRRRSTAAHELGHFVLGDEYSSDLGVHTSRDHRERVINSFAAELLLPMSAVEQAATEGECSRRDLIRLAAVYRTSWTLAVHQAVKAGVGDGRKLRHQDRPTKAELMEAVRFAPQPDLESIRVPPLYAQAVLQAWRGSLISSARAIEMLRGELDASDLPDREELDTAP
ncbi:helix-turn-helix domain-containing protein [Actinomadura parmotrematis]|uniref:ImmA/IrrE family metallo-endopeptidase n=1 Tax=Actinomadura parmotrematis TaxID=2864039 RepID=A0ABS7FV28_9ACTN|nr:XRE family transcriptional regulator [Actinomadura parmotrematis]MBW8484274.1 ImmA/IrrE family metallo-endopeptidase [Actinomadura parmotrematis]